MTFRFIHEIVESVAARDPHATAVVARDGTAFSYEEILRRAEGIAGELKARGAGAESVVAVSLTQDASWIATILGIWKAGAVYMPVDLEWPEERAHEVFRVSGAKWCVQCVGQRELRGMGTERKTLWLDDRIEAVNAISDGSPARSRLHPQSAAYIIFTSGSTGEPRGVMVPHQGIPLMAEQCAAVVGIKPGRRLLQFFRPTSDASLYEIFITLVSGGTLVFVEQSQLCSAVELLSALKRLSINVSGMPTSFLQCLPLESLDSLNTIMVGGEPCTPELVSRWGSSRTFINAYGPTEATVTVTIHRCEPTMRGSVIGKELPGVDLYVLDASLQPVPGDESGELFISGPLVARGYLASPEATAAQFVPDPFQRDGRRMYRTGDVARRLDDGTLEFLGRVDDQVKIRGHRVELNDVKLCLERLDGVAHASVVDCRRDSGDAYLAAWIVLTDQSAQASRSWPDEVLKHARRLLPGHMVPSRVHVVSELPRRSSGKVDVDALRARERTDFRPVEVQTRSSVRDVVHGIWSRVLQKEEIGDRETFFEAGGTSLSIVRVQGELRKVLQLDVPIADLFAFTTVPALTERVEKLMANGAAEGREEPAPQKSEAAGTRDRRARLVALRARRNTL